MKNFCIILLSTTTSLFLIAPASAQCVVADATAVPDISVDPLNTTGANELVQPLTLRFRRVGVDAPPLAVTYQIIDEDSSVRMRVGMDAGPQIEWQSNDAGRNIGALRRESYALLRSGTVSFGSGENSKEVSLRLFVKNLGDDLPAGVYREQYTVRYWCGDPTATVPNELSGVVSVAIRVPNVLSANVAGGSTRGEIDFLDFAALSRSLAISVRSTGPYKVTARSLNGGFMVRTESPSTAEIDRISYSLRFGGQPMTGDGGASFSNPRAGLQGLQIPLEVKVEDVSGKRAGKYSDTVFLTLTPAS